MRTFLFATAGFLGGIILSYGVALVWNPPYDARSFSLDTMEQVQERAELVKKM